MAKIDWHNDNGPVKRNYTCPAETCGQTFTFVHKTPKSPPPRFCPCCGYDTQGDDAQQLDMTFPSPLLGKVITVAADNTYRAMEEGSAHRAMMAKEQFGLSDAEANELKITDLRTNNVTGEDSAARVNNEVSRAMEATPGLTGFQNAGNAAEFARTSHAGYAPHAGRSALSMVRGAHAKAGFQTSEISHMG